MYRNGNDWLTAIPTDRPAVIVADGLLGFLTQDEMASLLNRLISHLPGACPVEKLSSTVTPGLPSGPPSTLTAPQSVADLIKFPGFDDPREFERWNPKLTLVKEILLSREPEVAQFPRSLRWYYRMSAHSTSWSRKGNRNLTLHLLGRRDADGKRTCSPPASGVLSAGRPFKKAVRRRIETASITACRASGTAEYQ